LIQPEEVARVPLPFQFDQPTFLQPGRIKQRDLVSGGADQILLTEFSENARHYLPHGPHMISQLLLSEMRDKRAAVPSAARSSRRRTTLCRTDDSPVAAIMFM
jgi:hypothetical protein